MEATPTSEPPERVKFALKGRPSPVKCYVNGRECNQTGQIIGGLIF